MKKLIIVALSVLFIVMSAQAQIKIDNPLDVNLEINADGQTMVINALQKNVLLQFVKPNRSTKFLFRWMANGKVKSQSITKQISGNHWSVSQNELMTGQPDVQAVVVNNSDFNTSEPGVGKVNFIKNVDAKILKFNLTIENNTGKDLIFIGDIFNGVALRPFDHVKSVGLVQPGLIEIAVLYKIADTTGIDSIIPSGQATAFNQQALAYMVIDKDQIIHIRDKDLLDPISMTNKKIKFQNVGDVTLYPNVSSKNKRLHDLAPGERSGVVKIKDLNDLVWYYNDMHTGIRRIAVFQIILGRTPIVEIRPMNNVYGAAKSRK